MKGKKDKGIIFYVIIVELVILIGLNIFNIYMLFNTVVISKPAIYCVLTTLILLIVLFATCWMAKGSFNIGSKEFQYQLKKSSFESIKKLNMSLRVQRHDFLNHIQVIYSLIQLNKNRDAEKYIKELYEDIDEVSHMPKTGNIPLDALLQSKLRKAKKKNIEISFEIDNHIKKLPVEPWEVSSIFGNLIDNAIDACAQTKNRKARIEVDIFCDDMNFVFSVNNNCGPIISKKFFSRIFEPGFTTKKEKGNGLGLYIVKTIADKYNGIISVASDCETGTTFKVCLPIEKQDACI